MVKSSRRCLFFFFFFVVCCEGTRSPLFFLNSLQVFRMANSNGCMVEDGEEIAKLLNGELPNNSPHPELCGGRQPFPHSFSPRQMVVMAAICDTVIPSLPLEASSQPDAAKAKLFETSASDTGIVPEIAGMVSAWMTREQFVLLHLALLMLSTRLGTFLVAGFSSVTTTFPFFQPFAALGLARREKILLGWSQSMFSKLQMLFKVAKCYTLYKFYSGADEKGSNPAWEAIGYQIPKPILEQETPLPSPLEHRVIDAKAPNLYDRLAAVGCTMLDDVGHLSGLVRNGRMRSKSRDFGIKCDVVVVGSGSGGGVVAAQLAELGYSVVVVEKGGYFPRKGLSMLEGPSMLAMYEQSGALTTTDGSVILLTGATLGGGSAVNWAASLKTPDHVLREWTSMGLERFDLGPAGDGYREAMAAVCARIGVQEHCSDESLQNAALRRGCTAMGYPVGYIPRNAGADHYCGFCGFGCPAMSTATRKQSAIDTWLSDAAAAGAVILTGCKADAILTSAKGSTRKALRARGIFCAAGDSSMYVEARVCVAACGSLFTPPLLRRSGLRNPHIGRHLSIHPVQMVWGYIPQGKIHPGKSYEGGIMTTFSTVGANWTTTGYGSILETPSLHPGTYATVAPWRSGADFKYRMLRFPRTANVIVLNRDRGRGTVCEDRLGKLIVEYPLYSADKQSLVEGASCALRALVAAGAESVGTHCIEGEIFSTKSSSSQEFEDYLKRVSSRMFSRELSTPLMSAHQMGSCRMGVDPVVSAVDPNCETWEVEGLFVGDASVFPTSSGVNPMITIQSIAYCTAKAVARFLKETN